jgi:hypothetical protein
MNKIILTGAAGLLLGVAMSPAVPGQAYYCLSVDILAEDGSAALHQQMKCPRYEKCSNTFPVTLQGKQEVLTVNAQVSDDHHIQITVNPDMRFVVAPDGNVRRAPFDSDTEIKAFESGNAWTMELQDTFTVPLDPIEQKFKWITTEQQRRTVLKLHMKLDS